jgi:hypothetical protein
VTLVGERVYDFDLAVFDIDEAIDRSPDWTRNVPAA